MGFTVAVLFFMTFLIMIIGFYTQYRAIISLDNAVMIISQDIVTCEDLDEAREQALEEAYLILGDTKVIPKNSITVDVNYSLGSEQEWKKGNFITVYLSADIKSFDPFTSGVKNTSAMVMIENNGGGTN